MAKGKMIYLDEDKKIGHMRVAEDLVIELNELAKELKMSRSGLMRRALESFGDTENVIPAFLLTPNFL